MRDELEDVESNCLWEDIKRAILNEACQNIPRKHTTSKSPWLSSEAISIAREKRGAKSVGDSKLYKKLNADF